MRWVPAGLYMLLVFVVSSISAPTLPHVGWQHFDKVIHFTEFAVLGALVMWAWRRYWPSVILATLYGTIDELHQLFTPGRDSSVYDALADAAGALLGAALCAYVLNRWRERTAPKPGPERGS